MYLHHIHPYEYSSVFSRETSQRKSARLGKRKVDKDTGTIFYKKAPQDHISGALQLGITTVKGNIISTNFPQSSPLSLFSDGFGKIIYL